jgi:single-stranded-DNA-specific exonuclease
LIPDSQQPIVQQSEVSYDGILFFHSDPLPDLINAVYRLQINEYNGKTTLQFLLEHWSQVDPAVTRHAH